MGSHVWAPIYPRTTKSPLFSEAPPSPRDGSAPSSFVIPTIADPPVSMCGQGQYSKGKAENHPQSVLRHPLSHLVFHPFQMMAWQQNNLSPPAKHRLWMMAFRRRGRTMPPIEFNPAGRRESRRSHLEGEEHGSRIPAQDRSCLRCRGCHRTYVPGHCRLRPENGRSQRNGQRLTG